MGGWEILCTLLEKSLRLRRNELRENKIQKLNENKNYLIHVNIKNQLARHDILT